MLMQWMQYAEPSRPANEAYIDVRRVRSDGGDKVVRHSMSINLSGNFAVLGRNKHFLQRINVLKH